MKTMMKLETRNDIWELRHFGDWIPKGFLRNLIWAKDNNHISYVEVDASTNRRDWDGTLKVKLSEGLDAVFVVNRFVALAHADEVNMEDANTLSFWWD